MPDDGTIQEDRPISEHEAAIVEWMIRHDPNGRLLHLASSIPQLRVVGRCGCGCASVDFECGGQGATGRPIANAEAQTPRGSVGLILWGREDAITGLEVYELSAAEPNPLPAVSELVPWLTT